MELAVKEDINIDYAYISGGLTTMEKVKVAYPVSDSTANMQSSTETYVFKSIFASLAGASIPALIFYFLM
ncbi:MAG: hypothetical protein HN472_01430 [Nitrospina sp.]|jgi:hypothetical protein|nr:hypothetical protein [Nitrospina sp.]MBT3508190.1 hypothetical protein [Nitrospina sp.]MBT3874831.1 hypothetical protein [Nitrospina sp.]MBT4048007.1 hypothetical protein [Nitrospina sp.]MBT4555966.1 hypothetical protein [Nitrospina sp.]